MKNSIQLVVLLFLISTSSCDFFLSTKDVLLESNDIIKIMEACQEIIDSDEVDASMAVPLLTHIFDPRCSTELEFTHHSPYYMRIKALERITGEKYNYEDWLDTELDALVVDKYLNWCLEKGLIQTKNDIYLFQPIEFQNISSKGAIRNIVNSDKVDWLDQYDWPARQGSVFE